jgi:hypothetical protein
MRAKLAMDKTAKALGAQRRGKVVATGGHLGATQLAAEVQARFDVPRRAKLKKDQEPSRASLREMPEMDFSDAKPNPYARRLAAEGVSIQLERGRPRKGSKRRRLPAR